MLILQYQNILGFDISMDDVYAMNIMHCSRDLQRDIGTRTDRDNLNATEISMLEDLPTCAKIIRA